MNIRLITQPQPSHLVHPNQWRFLPCYRWVLGCLWLLVSTGISGQSPEESSNQLISGKNYLPPSPEVASLFQASQIPVNFYTGQPNIQVPIFTVSSGGLQVPIGLSYDASGVRLDDVPGPAGLKWSLQAGGAITRAVNSLPDESLPGGLINTYATFSDYLANCISSIDPACTTYRQDAQAGRLDTEPDQFYFHAPGLQGSFFYTGNQHFVSQPYSHLKIEGAIHLPDIQSFTITQLDGTRYIFSDVEVTEDRSELYNGQPQPSPPFHSAWFLSQIISADLKDTLFFTYATHTENLRARNSQSQRLGLRHTFSNQGPPPCNPPPFTNHPILTHVTTKRITEIRSRTHRVTFDYAPRQDLIDWVAGTPNGQQLSRIQVRTYNGNLLKSFQLHYTMYQQRNYLMRLEEHAGGDLLSHQFEYHQPTSLPLPIWYRTLHSDPSQEILAIRNNLLSTDFWGYYTGRTETSPYPSVIVQPLVNGIYTAWNFADKSPNEASTKYGTLTKITYPTKGYTSFDYELNDYGRIAGFKAGNSYHGRTGITFREGPLVTRSLATSPSVWTDTLQLHTLPISGSPLRAHITGSLSPTGTNETVGMVRIEETYAGVTRRTLLIIDGADDAQGNFDRTVVLEPGKTYVLTIMTDAPNHPVDATISYTSQIPAHTQTGGGLRLKRLRMSDGINPSKDIIKNYSYIVDPQATGSPDISSGVLNHAPHFVYAYFAGDCQYIRVYSTNQQYLSSGQWGQIGYSRVVETLHNGEIGQKVYEYTTAWDYPDEFHCDNPTAGYHIEVTGGMSQGLTNPCTFQLGPRADNSWKRGDLIRESTLSATGKKLTEQSHSFAFSHDAGSPLNISSINQTISGIYLHLLPASGMLEGIISNYTIPIGFKHLQSSTSKTWPSTNASTYSPHTYLETTTEYFYDSPQHLQMTRQRSTSSDGKIHETKIKYISDYQSTLQTGPNANVSIQHLLAKHLLALPVEQANFVNGQFVGGTVTSYTNISSTASQVDQMAIKPHQVFVAELSDPITGPAYATAEDKRNGRYRKYLPNLSQGYVERLESMYHTNGLLAEEQLVDGLYPNPPADPKVGKSYTYLWNHLHLPIAQALNAKQDAVAYTSFESLASTNLEGGWFKSGASGGWSTQSIHLKTGLRGFNLGRNTRTITSKQMPAGTYLLSFWYTTNSSGSGRALTIRNGQTSGVLARYNQTKDMTYVQLKVSLNSNQTIRIQGDNRDTFIDELRLHPTDAQMTTYCYDDWLRLHTETDISGRSTSYEYDPFNRLAYIRDQAGNYVQGFEYNYAR